MHHLTILIAGTTNDTVKQERGDFAQWIREGVGDAWPHGWKEHDLRDESPLPAPDSAAGFIITGSSSSVTERAPWMLRAEELIREIARSGTPLLGICFGHQLIAQALGGLVIKNPRGREIGTAEVGVLEDDPLFEGLGRTFPAHATHVDTAGTLPHGARLLATTSGDGAAAFAVGATTRAVQFHPEFDDDIIRRYIRARRELIRSEGLDPDALHDAVRKDARGGDLLRNFVRHIVRPRSGHRGT